jgi:hypothetical protein
MQSNTGEAMDEYVVQGSLGMPRGSSLRIDDGRGMLVYVWEGELWLTQEDSQKDHMLAAGGCFRIDRDGATIAHSLRRSVVTLSSPEADCQARRIVLVKGAALPLVLHRETGWRAIRTLRRLWHALLAPHSGLTAAAR